MVAKRLRFTMAAATSLCLAAPAYAQASDDAAIRTMVKAQESAFDAHDAAAYGRFLEADADIVTSLGWRVRGREAYVRKLGEAFAGALGRAHVHADAVTIRLLATDLALAHIKWTDTAARKGGEAIESQVLRRQPDGRWLIASSQATDVRPERAAASAKDGEEPAAVPQPTRRCLLARGNGDCLIYK